jgi:gamma-glutamylcyclotransferase (GGCT)/AIG2-like uncharacterized protein YtfP
MPTTKLYLAYGSNMNKAQMRHRCPKAKPLRAIVIDDARLVFRGVADIEFHKGASVPVALWEITEDCERALDRFEGVSAGVYEKKMIPLDNGEQALTYIMRSNGVAPPSREYYERIKQGYADFGIDPEPLDVALKHSHVKTNHTAETRRRMARNMAQGNRQATRPMHVPLSKVDPSFERHGSRLRGGARAEDFDTCRHGWPLGVCEECNEREEREEREERQGTLQLVNARRCEHGREPAFCTKCRELNARKPVARPVEGFNYSEAAKRGTRNHEGETEATNTGKVRMNGGKRSNKVTRKSKNKNLGDWMRERGYK